MERMLLVSIGRDISHSELADLNEHTEKYVSRLKLSGGIKLSLCKSDWEPFLKWLMDNDVRLLDIPKVAGRTFIEVEGLFSMEDRVELQAYLEERVPLYYIGNYIDTTRSGLDVPQSKEAQARSWLLKHGHTILD